MSVSEPVTVAITRRVEPGNARLMRAWFSAGVQLAESFEGFLGVGWVRTDAQEWHMLYRFRDRATLNHWESSPERHWWLHSGVGLFEETRVEHRTGIEGWFDEPADSVHIQNQPVPPRWKQAVAIWLAFFPVNLAASWLLTPVIGEQPLVLRVLTTTLILTPLMVYFFLPLSTKALRPWLLRGL